MMECTRNNASSLWFDGNITACCLYIDWLQIKCNLIKICNEDGMYMVLMHSSTHTCVLHQQCTHWIPVASCVLTTDTAVHTC